MAPLEGKFAEAQRRMKYRSQNKETTIETTILIYRGRGSIDALNAPSERDALDARWEACISHVP